MIELARPHSLPKPWGIIDLHPWSSARNIGNPIGEIWYERSDSPASHPSLLLKLLFTNQPLSIQVHPDDAFAHSIGLARGKSEAWYVLSAAPDAKIAVGLKRHMTPQELRDAIDDGSIETLVAWRKASAGDVISVPAGTVHAIGAGLVIAEIQQRSDATFRLFDYGRQRELHIDSGVAVANTGPADVHAESSWLSNERTLLVANPHFVFERIEVPPDSGWSLEAERETWLLVIAGDAKIKPFNVRVGDAVFAQSDRVIIRAGATGMVALAAYTGSKPIVHFLQDASGVDTIVSGRRKDVRAAAALPQANGVSATTNSDVFP